MASHSHWFIISPDTWLATVSKLSHRSFHDGVYILFLYYILPVRGARSQKVVVIVFSGKWGGLGKNLCPYVYIYIYIYINLIHCWLLIRACKSPEKFVTLVSSCWTSYSHLQHLLLSLATLFRVRGGPD